MLTMLAEEASSYGVRLSAAQMEQFERYLTLLTSWSERMNLVGDVSPEVVRRRHFLESIALGASLREREVLRREAAVLDVGTGAGFPGAVLKIVWPSIRLTLLEATAKKAAFLLALVQEVPLPDTEVIGGRAETLAHEEALRGRYDLVVARAVAPLRTLLELALPFATVGGRVITPKGSRAGAEVTAAERALEVLGGQAFVVPLRAPGRPQSIVAVVKLRETPADYPRRPGVPKKHPL